MAKKKKNKGRGRLVCLAAALAAVMGAAWLALQPGAGAEATIRLRKGTTDQALADTLQAHFGSSYASRVGWLIAITGTDMAHREGAWTIKQGESPLRAARRLSSGAQSGLRFTFNNVRTKHELAERAGALFMASTADFERALNNPELCAKYGKTPESIVCLFLPDSYDLYWTTTPEKLVERMSEYYDEFWTAERRKQAKALGLEPDQVVTIASIAEEETSKADERGKVGRLYINRYRSGQRLQADPTVKFALGDFTIKRLTHEMLQTQSPYNTYRNGGLPPGPIRLPEKSTIDAVLTSQAHNYMYMCARPDFSGYHDFTVSYDDHLANAHRYQQALNQRGIK